MPPLFRFFPPKPAKKYNPVLVPNSILLPRSALVPVDPKMKERKFDGSLNKNPAHGPVNAYAMGSDPGGIGFAGADAGYGNSNYGLNPYGEAKNKKFRKNKKEKAMFEELENRMPDSLYDRRPGIFYDRMPDLHPVP